MAAVAECVCEGGRLPLFWGLVLVLCLWRCPLPDETGDEQILTRLAGQRTLLFVPVIPTNVFLETGTWWRGVLVADEWRWLLLSGKERAWEWAKGRRRDWWYGGAQSLSCSWTKVGMQRAEEQSLSFLNPLISQGKRSMLGALVKVEKGES